MDTGVNHFPWLQEMLSEGDRTWKLLEQKLALPTSKEKQLKIPRPKGKWDIPHDHSNALFWVLYESRTKMKNIFGDMQGHNKLLRAEMQMWSERKDHT